MMGYLDDVEATEKALCDGWYVTGDLGTVDSDGFLFIHDRVSRFSKIAGEMVSHAAVENALLEAAGDDEHRFAVISAPDRLRGERLIALYDGAELDVKDLTAAMSGAEIPNLWIPSVRDFLHVDSVPYLATGKLDLRQARSLATDSGALGQKGD